MYEFRVHTLIDITDNGNLKREFPFKTSGNEVVHDKHTLTIARHQNANFNTMIQLLQMRGNITWEVPPMKVNETLGNSAFGSAYEGKHISWHFAFFTEQTDVYGKPQEPTAQLIDDFHLVPILNFCKETATFPTATFITQNSETINTYFSYAGEINK
jgi:hypothetical protein